MNGSVFLPAVKDRAARRLSMTTRQSGQARHRDGRFAHPRRADSTKSAVARDHTADDPGDAIGLRIRRR